jgi:predicted enzyme related to lactoylglutathione lyase
MIHFGFTKIVVADLERCAAFYSDVFGLREHYRVHDTIGGRPIDEILYEATAPDGGTFVLLRFADAPDVASAGVLTGFITDEIDALFERAVAAGATVVDDVHDAPEHGVRVGFLADPEGRFIEVVQLLAADGASVPSP